MNIHGRASGSLASMGVCRAVFSGPVRAAALLVLLAVASALTGCGPMASMAGPTYTMHVDAYAESVPYGRRFYILPGIMETKSDDAEFKAVAARLSGALVAKGYTHASSLAEADLGLYLVYRVREDGRSQFDTFSQRAMGPTPRPFFVLTYIREVSLEAVDMARFARNDPRHVVWKINIVSKGPTSDLQKAMPALAAAIAEYAGTSGESYVEVDGAGNIRPFKPSRPAIPDPPLPRL
ncbi:hypothetical protein [Fundidesulfovibrio putealis]|uniref:hypothetical protein n=1 Tax=Fundidesulfovibrio putealis TaxID=270496 RepID=UPI00042A52BE|nr:hypothetical protein [Fundidesulfovibrio putealis]